MKKSSPAASKSALKSYSFPWQGQILLACGKCQRKLSKSGDPSGLGKLKKTLKKSRPRIFVIKTPCLDVCPKGGVTVCTSEQVARGQFSILQDEQDLDALLLGFTGRQRS